MLGSRDSTQLAPKRLGRKVLTAADGPVLGAWAAPVEEVDIVGLASLKGSHVEARLTRTGGHHTILDGRCDGIGTVRDDGPLVSGAQFDVDKE